MSWRKIILLMNLSFSFYIKASSGDWGSGGGYVWGNSQNPWFLKNNSIIKYCIEIDSNRFNVPMNEIIENIRNAFNFWDEEIDRYIYFEKKLHLNISAAQSIQTRTYFMQSHCDENIDLVFQFGFLTQEQKEKLKAQSIPTENSLGLAIRTEYDTTKMKGKGFIYIAAESEELKRKFPILPLDFWNNTYNLLYSTLIHELGHVFGIAHINEENNIMSENFVESFFSTQFPNLRPAVALKNNYEFSYPKMVEQNLLKRFFLDDSNDEIRDQFILEMTEISPEKVNFKIIYQLHNTMQLAAEFESNQKLQVKIKNLDKIHIPLDQKIKEEWKIFAGSKIALFNQIDLTVAGNLHIKKTNESIPAALSFNNNEIKLTLFYKNQIFPNIFAEK